MRMKFRLIAAALLAAFACLENAQAQSVQVTNAADFSATSVSPGSIVTLFGSNLATATASAPNSATPPTALAGASVTIGGTAAALFYVSPWQINAVVPSTVAPGTQPVVVTSSAGTVTGSVTIAVNAAPGLFSTTGTGTHDGAIIQALTGRIGAFSVNSGSGSNYLSLFLTGANLTATPVVTIAGVNANVTYAGVSPCCDGLQQINITLPASLAGGGRVPVTVTAGGQMSNAVEIVILPVRGLGEFDADDDNQTRSRELSAVAWIPGTSLALVADENDDVVREIDVAGQSVVHTIALRGDSEPAAIAVTADGSLAVVALRHRSRVAVIDLASLTVKAEVKVGAGPVGVAINGTTAVVANGDNANATVVDLTTDTAAGTVSTGRGPRGVAIDAAGHAYVTNQDDGTISVIDIASLAVTATLNLTSSADTTPRPSAIQLVAGTGFALVADPAAGDAGMVLAVNLTTGTITSFSVNAARTGGSNDIAMAGMTAYIANQAGGSVSILPLTIAGGTVTGTAATVPVGQGVRSVAVDTNDNVLLAVNESSGRIAIVSLSSDQVIGRIAAVVAERGECDDGDDDHSDHECAPNLPRIVSISPESATAGSTFTLTVVGTHLMNATGVAFFTPSAIPAPGWIGKGADGMDGKGVMSAADTAFTVTGIQVNDSGTQLTATVAIAANASSGVRLVRVLTPNGESVAALAAGNTFSVTP